MVISPEFRRLNSVVRRPLLETAFDAVREAVLVVDTRLDSLPIALCNAAARALLSNSFSPDHTSDSLIDFPLSRLLDRSTRAALDAAIHSQTASGTEIVLDLTWATANGARVLPTTLRVLPASGHKTAMVMLTVGRASKGRARRASDEEGRLNGDSRMVKAGARRKPLRAASPLGTEEASARAMIARDPGVVSAWPAMSPADINPSCDPGPSARTKDAARSGAPPPSVPIHPEFREQHSDTHSSVAAAPIALQPVDIASMAGHASWALSSGDHISPSEAPCSTGPRAAGSAAGPVSRQFVAPSYAVPLDVLILDQELRVAYANAGAALTAGSLPGEILGHSALMLMPTAAMPREALTCALDGAHYHCDDIAVSIPGRATRWFEVDVQPLRDASGIAGLAILSRDVTARRPAAGATMESEHRLTALTEHAHDIITVANSDGSVNFVSASVTSLLGYGVEERRDASIFENFHPADLPEVKARFSELVNGQCSTFSRQLRVRHKGGSYRWLEVSFVSALANPLIKGVVINARDITEQRKAQTQMALREEVFRLAAEAVNGIIFEWDLLHQVVHRSFGVREVLGLDPDKLAPQGAWSARLHPQDTAAYCATLSRALNGERGWTTTYRIKDARGFYRSILERALIERDEQKNAIRAIGCCVDVSEIQRLTDLLAETQRTAKMGGWEFSFTTRKLTWTEEMFRIFETEPQNFELSVDAMLEHFTDESRQRFETAFVGGEAAEPHNNLELEIITFKGRHLWVCVKGHVESVAGAPFRAFGSMQDIQSQKLAQIALENSSSWLKLSMNMAHLDAWRWNRCTDTLEFAIVNGQRISTPRELRGLSRLMARVHPRDRSALREAMDRAFREHTEVQQQFRLRSETGEYVYYAAVARPQFDASGEPVGLVGVTQDVTERHDAEERLRRSEEVLRITTANAPDILVLLDEHLNVKFINRAVGEMSVDAIIGEHVSIFLPVAARSRAIAKLQAVLATSEAATYEIIVEAASDKPAQYLEGRAVLVSDQGRATGISIVMRDVTERRRLEQEILDVASRERQSIGRDLHDGLGQELTGVALMLRGLTRRLQQVEPESVAQVNEIVTLINQSIASARALARGLLPVCIQSGGLVEALQALAERSRIFYGLDVTFASKVMSDEVFSQAHGSHWYRIAQEALTNVARHAHASAVTLSLESTPEVCELEIADDGIGISDRARVSVQAGMGLKIMQYRAEMIGAKLEVVPNRPHGTIIRARRENASPATKEETEWQMERSLSAWEAMA